MGAVWVLYGCVRVLYGCIWVLHVCCMNAVRVEMGDGMNGYRVQYWWMWVLYGRCMGDTGAVQRGVGAVCVLSGAVRAGMGAV